VATGPSRGRAVARRRGFGDLAAILFVGLLLWGVTFLPPDTTLAEVQRTGVLRVCVPGSYPPLVTGDPGRPGLDIELLQEVSDGLDLRLVPVTNVSIGRDFNPRNWRVTRAQCLVLAGGIVDAAVTRSFLVVTQPHLETGWAAVTLDASLASLDGVDVGFYSGLTGLDRLALSAWLRARRASVAVVSSFVDARSGLAEGRFRVVVTEALAARRIAEDTGATAYWLPVADSRVPLAFGLWKGDLTLQRAVERELRRIERDGILLELLDRYALGPIEESCSFCE
jgi:ABC-type amino acid transport substrate-binding protein